jgi:hypothetical protein
VYWKRAKNHSDYATLPDRYAFCAYTPAYSIATGSTYRVTAYTQFHTPSRGVQWPSEYGVYRFWLASVHAAARKELAYYDYYIGNPPTDSLVSLDFTVTPVLKSARTTLTQQNSALRVDFKGANIDVTDEIWLEFETHNNIERVFDDDLGVMSSVLLTYGGG